jgi:hypothetical protein
MTLFATSSSEGVIERPLTKATIYRPAYSLDQRTFRIDQASGDWRVDDLAVLMLEQRVIAEAIALHELAGKPPTIVYAAGAAALRVFDSRFRLAGRTSRFIESDYRPDEAQEAFRDLRAGRLDVLITRRPYTPGPAIAGVAVMLARPTRLSELFAAFLARLQAPVRVIDLALNCERLGLPSDWDLELVLGASTDLIVDTMLDRLATVPASQLQRWAEGDRGRLQLIAVARGYKIGWVEISAKAWLDAQVKNRARPPLRPDRRSGRATATA